MGGCRAKTTTPEGGKIIGNMSTTPREKRGESYCSLGGTRRTHQRWAMLKRLKTRRDKFNFVYANKHLQILVTQELVTQDATWRKFWPRSTSPIFGGFDCVARKFLFPLSRYCIFSRYNGHHRSLERSFLHEHRALPPLRTRAQRSLHICRPPHREPGTL
jgi:hypothetical protein